MCRRIKDWIIAVRAFSFVTTVVPILLGGVLAQSEGSLNLVLLIYTLLGGLCLHGGTNLINDYYDNKNGVDNINSHQSCELIFNNVISLNKIYRVGVTLLATGIAIGFHLAIYKGVTVAILGAIGAIGGYFYTANPINLKYKGLGIPVVFLLMGPMMVFGSYYVQTMKFNAFIPWLSIPIGLLVAAILHSNDLRDIEEDSRSGIKTFSVLVGRRKSVFLFYVLIITSYLFILALVVTRIASPIFLGIFITLPHAIKLMSSVKLKEASKEKELLLVPSTAKFYGQFGLVLIIVTLFIK